MYKKIISKCTKKEQKYWNMLRLEYYIIQLTHAYVIILNLCDNFIVIVFNYKLYATTDE